MFWGPKFLKCALMHVKDCFCWFFFIGSKYTHFSNRGVSLVRKNSLGVRDKKKNREQEEDSHWLQQQMFP